MIPLESNIRGALLKMGNIELTLSHHFCKWWLFVQKQVAVSQYKKDLTMQFSVSRMGFIQWVTMPKMGTLYLKWAKTELLLKSQCTWMPCWRSEVGACHIVCCDSTISKMKEKKLYMLMLVWHHMKTSGCSCLTKAAWASTMHGCYACNKSRLR